MRIPNRPMILHFFSVCSFVFLSFMHVHAKAEDGQMKFNYTLTDVSQVIEDYSKATGQKFIYDPQIRGKVTVINPQRISLEEAFAQLSTALAVNGLGISNQGDVMVVMQARGIQRNYIDIGTTLPPLRPERMFTWVIELKHASADRINKELRILTSKDGELVPVLATNQILVTDWVSNLHRIQKIIEAVDRPGKDRDSNSAWNQIVIPPVQMAEQRKDPAN